MPLAREKYLAQGLLILLLPPCTWQRRMFFWMESFRHLVEKLNSSCGPKAMKAIRYFIIFELSGPSIVLTNVYLQDVLLSNG